MKKLFITLATALVGLAAMAADPVAITFKTNINKEPGESYYFHFNIGTTETTYIDVDCGYGPVEYEIAPAVWNPETQAISGTSIVCQVNAESTVTIYADPMLIDYFDAEGCYLTSIDLGECYNLEILDLQHNELKSLDLSPYTKLAAVYLGDNTFSPQTPLIVGDNHPDLMILQLDMVDWISPDFDIATYPNLLSFDGYAARNLRKITPSGCPKLMSLSIDLTQIEELDVTQNPYLQVLNIEDTRITDIDLSKNPNLTQFYCSHNSSTVNSDIKLKSIDLSHNPLLQVLFASGNDFTSIDVSNNPALIDLYLSYNYLTEINLDNCPDIYNLVIKFNNFDFTTLPLPRNTFLDYRYEQRPMKTERCYLVGTELDFSAKVLREGTTTDAVLYTWQVGESQPTLLDNSYYKYENGKVTLLKEYGDSIYVSFGNSAFPEQRLTTEKFMVKNAENYGKPSCAAYFISELNQGDVLSMGIGLAGASATNPRKFMVEFGDGVMREFTATSETLPAEPNVKAPMAAYGYVRIQLPEGEKLTALEVKDVNIYSCDVSAAGDLEYLTLANCGLYTIELENNKNLRALDLSGNKFHEISLAPVNGAYEKTRLNVVNLSNNFISDLTLHETRVVTYLDLSHNELETFGYKDFDNIKYLDLSYNHLSAVELGYMTSAEHIDLSNNLFEELILPVTTTLKYVNLSNNSFTFSKLPYLVETEDFEYVAAPQKPVLLPTRGPGCDLSDQCRTEDGHSTVFNWYTTDGTCLTPGVDYSIENGVTRFINTSVGEVHCEMTNEAWPMFSGENVMKTTNILADKMPEYVLASFTTPVGGEPVSLSLAGRTRGTTIYFDWSGNGSSLDQYMLDTTYLLFDATTVEGAEVKVYAYDESEKISVFSITGATMTDLDLSKLNDLITLTINEAGISDMIYPNTENLEQLNLADNSFESIDLTKFPNLKSLTLSNNNLTTLDISSLDKLEVLGCVSNNLSEFIPGSSNPRLWMLLLSHNKLSEIDLSSFKALEQLELWDNELETIDVSTCTRLQSLLINNNRFTFATLPTPSAKYAVYQYHNQQPLSVECVDGQVDLSSQATVKGTQTVYRWFVGVPSFDENNELVGEELIVNDEYTIENGVTTFNCNLDDVMCVMTNSVFPNLYLYTYPMKVSAGVYSVAIDGEQTFTAVAHGNDILVNAAVADGETVNVHSLEGRLIGSAEIIGGEAVVHGVPAGIAIVSLHGSAVKVAVK